MFKRTILRALGLAFFCLGVITCNAWAQTGALTGKVTLAGRETPVHNALIFITQLKLTTQTDEQGRYEFKAVPNGTYSVIARLERLPDSVQRVEIKGETTLDFELRLTGIREQVTVSASGTAQTAFESFQGVTGLDSTSLLENNSASLGDALEKQAGITKRSSGPGAARPVIRGFDGDRVMIAQDGIRSGSVSYSSGDHGEPINVLSIKRLEVVRGPATLLFGSSALGGIVNAVSDHEHAHEGYNGFLSGAGASAFKLGGVSAGFEYGTKRWMAWGSGGAQKSGAYNSPLGQVPNSGTKNLDFTGGAGHFGKQSFFNASYSFNKNVYGVPYDPTDKDAELVSLDPRRHSLRLNGGFNELNGPVEHVHLTFDYTHYRHDEIIGGAPQTRFFNQTYSYRGVAEQPHHGKLSGSFGVNGFYRAYEVEGAEALVPPTKQNSFAAFGVEQLDFGKAAFQFGGRVERNSYDTVSSAERVDRAFTGFSGAAGIRAPLWEGAVSANYSHTDRAPSLDELYNQGPHPGNLTFEIGNTNLKRERGDGVDLSFRQAHKGVRAEINYFYYRLRNYIFLAPTGAREEGLPVAAYLQGDARYTGAEVDASAGLNKYVALNAGLDYVSARLTSAGKLNLPRIPPLRARFGVEFNYKTFRLFPEVTAARQQAHVFTNETPTAGWATINLTAGYTYATSHAAHIFALNGFNLNDKLYRNHLSFLKAIAPEVGRGVRVTYTVRFF